MRFYTFFWVVSRGESLREPAGFRFQQHSRPIRPSRTEATTPSCRRPRPRHTELVAQRRRSATNHAQQKTAAHGAPPSYLPDRKLRNRPTGTHTHAIHLHNIRLHDAMPTKPTQRLRKRNYSAARNARSARNARRDFFGCGAKRLASGFAESACATRVCF